MCFLSYVFNQTNIPSDMCFPTQETYIPSDMCSRVGETHFTRDLCSHRETLIGEDREFLEGKMIHFIGETKKVQPLTTD